LYSVALAIRRSNSSIWFSSKIGLSIRDYTWTFH